MYIEQCIETTILIHRELLTDFVSLLLEERKHSALEGCDLGRLSSETAIQTYKATGNKSIKTDFQIWSFFPSIHLPLKHKWKSIIIVLIMYNSIAAKRHCDHRNIHSVTDGSRSTDPQ